jgi:CRISPR/Cas system-associated exonuclease Cas4 (RecB family)
MPAAIYNPSSKSQFRLSRSKIDLFIECPRCFYLDRRLGISRPSIPGFSLNSAVDTLLKKEFDLLRKKGESHELMHRYGISAVPYSHPDIDGWRDNFTGQQYLHQKTNFLLFGAVDDIWINSQKQLHIVDYKSTSTEKDISLNDKYKEGYKRQMEIYQWLFSQNGFPVSPIGYFVFANAGKNRPNFDARLEFELSIISYTGNTSWIDPVIFDIKRCLNSEVIPNSNPSCEHCAYYQNRNSHS